MKTTTLPKLVEFVIANSNIHGFELTPLKLQKVLYYIQAWHIARFDKNILFGELPQAWVNGPVYRSVYDTYKNSFYKSQRLVVKDKNFDEQSLNTIQDALGLEDEQLQVVRILTKYYLAMEESKLVLMTHADSPWNEARIGLGDFDRCEKEISIDSMFNFYNPRIQKKE